MYDESIEEHKHLKSHRFWKHFPFWLIAVIGFLVWEMCIRDRRQCQGGLSARQGGAYCSATATALQGRALNADRRLNCRQAL